MRSFFLNLIFGFFPTSLRAHAAALYRRYKGFVGPDLALISNFKNKEKIAVDIGANQGDYAYELARCFKKCFVFEPNKSALENLRKKNLKNIQINDNAISSEYKEMLLHVPIYNGELQTAWGSFESAKFSGYETKTYKVKSFPLDHFNFTNLGFLKIDVEGHEQSVIAGAKQTIQREKPVILIEIEERHGQGATSTLFNTLTDLGYMGFFCVSKERLRSIVEFDHKIHQKIENALTIGGSASEGHDYFNNFYFIHKSQMNDFYLDKLIQGV